VTDGQSEREPMRVPAGAVPVGEVRARWEWAEPAVWTERMLAALEDGVKGACFAEHGLFSLVAACAAASQSSRR